MRGCRSYRRQGEHTCRHSCLMPLSLPFPQHTLFAFLLLCRMAADLLRTCALSLLPTALACLLPTPAPPRGLWGRQAGVGSGFAGVGGPTTVQAPRRTHFHLLPTALCPRRTSHALLPCSGVLGISRRAVRSALAADVGLRRGGARASLAARLRQGLRRRPALCFLCTSLLLHSGPSFLPALLFLTTLSFTRRRT